MVDKKVLDALLTPKDEYTAKPFWSLNGALDINECKKQILAFKKMGYGGFFLHSRTGLITEYLSEEWFALLRECAAFGYENGMEAWLYDEDRWPSGTAGGYVTKNHRYRSKYMRLSAIGEVRGEALYYYHIELDEENNLVSYKQVDKNAANYALSVEEMLPEDFYNGYTYADLLNRETTDYFLSVTHEKYKEYLGDMFGKEIKGIFTDEPHRGILFGGFGAIKNERKHELAPYTYALFDEYKKRFKSELSIVIPELYYRYKDKPFSETAWRYVELLSELFTENFFKPYHDWTKKNNLLLTGHVLHEDNLVSQTVPCGSVMRCYEYFDIPGLDNLTEYAPCLWAAKQVASVAKQTDKRGVLSELYGVTGWQVTLERYKEMGDWQSILGVTLRCPHLSWYTMGGEAKRDYPASFYHQNAREEWAYMENYYARMHTLLNIGKPLAETLLISPVECVWGLAKSGAFKNLSSNLKEINGVEKDYLCAYRDLNSRGVEFDIADEFLLKKYGKITKNGLKLGKITYKKVIISQPSMRKSTLKLLNALVEGGGYVEYLSELKYVDCKPISDKPLERRGEVDIPVRIKNSDVVYATRKLGKDKYVVILSALNDTSCEVKTAENFTLTALDLRSGKVVGEEENRRFSLLKGEERAYYLSQVHGRKAKEEPVARECERLQGEYKYELNEENNLVLDVASYVYDGKRYPAKEVLRIDKSLREMLGLRLRGGEMLQPWYSAKLTDGYDKTLGKLTLDFEFFASFTPQQTALIYEGEFEVLLNGEKVVGKTRSIDFDSSYKRLEIPRALIRRGRNVLTLKADYKDSLNIEAAKLVGNFGVKLDGGKKTIIRLKKRLAVGDVTAQGLPFYSGSVIYHTGIHNGKLKVVFTQPCGTLVEVDFGKEKEIVAFKPFETAFHRVRGELKIKVMLTKRNEFGPLHYNDLHAHSYGPDKFITSDKYVDSYVLEGYGLMGEIKIDFL